MRETDFVCEMIDCSKRRIYLIFRLVLFSANFSIFWYLAYWNKTWEIALCIIKSTSWQALKWRSEWLVAKVTKMLLSLLILLLRSHHTRGKTETIIAKTCNLLPVAGQVTSIQWNFFLTSNMSCLQLEIFSISNAVSKLLYLSLYCIKLCCKVKDSLISLRYLPKTYRRTKLISDDNPKCTGWEVDDSL